VTELIARQNFTGIHVRKISEDIYALFWDFTQRKIAVSRRRFGSNYLSHLQGQSRQKRRS
jgi:hypothetical protein